MTGAACTGSAVRSQPVCLPGLLWRRRNVTARPTPAIATNSRLDGSGTCAGQGGWPGCPQNDGARAAADDVAAVGAIKRQRRQATKVAYK